MYASDVVKPVLFYQHTVIDAQKENIFASLNVQTHVPGERFHHVNAMVPLYDSR